jgi:GTPase SAR1 family protein
MSKARPLSALVGKSTLVNRILGEERVLAIDLPGTTRDSIYIPFEREGQKYTLIDTAGIAKILLSLGVLNSAPAFWYALIIGANNLPTPEPCRAEM